MNEPLTPEEVEARTFTATRFGSGYDSNEVDDFLDRVVSELRRLNAEIARLRVSPSHEFQLYPPSTELGDPGELR